MKIHVFYSPNARCIGDILRDVDGKALIMSDKDFLIVHGDLITTMDFSKVFEAHEYI
jgi:translation initiation factor eIF-2B subunit epsilon